MRIYSFALTALLTLTSLAAQVGNETPSPGTRLEELQQRLQLSPEQQEQIRPILLDEAAKVKEIRSKFEGQTSRRPRLQMLRQLRDVQQNLDKRITPLLTKEQRTEWKQIREERRDELREERK